MRQSPAPEIAGSAKATPAVVREAVARRFVMLVGNHEAGIEAGAGAPLRGEKQRQTNPAMRRNEQPQEAPDDRFKPLARGWRDTGRDLNKSVTLLDQPDGIEARLVQRGVTERGALSQTKRLGVGFDHQRLDTQTWADAAALATATWKYPGTRHRGVVAHERLTARDDVEHLLQRSHRAALCKKIRRGLEKFF